MSWRDKLSAINKGNTHLFHEGSPNDIEICNLFDRLELRGYKIKFQSDSFKRGSGYHRVKAIKKCVSIRFSFNASYYHAHFFVMTDTGGYIKIPDSSWLNGGVTPTFDQLLEKAEKHEIPDKIRDINSDNGFVKPVIMRKSFRNKPITAEFYFSDLLNTVETRGIVGVDGTKVNTDAVSIKDNDVWFLLFGRGRSGGTINIISDGNRYRYVKTRYDNKNKTYTATLTRNHKGDLTTNDQELIKCSIAWYVKCMNDQQEDK
jgi:hypothetical protein